MFLEHPKVMILMVITFEFQSAKIQKKAPLQGLLFFCQALHGSCTFNFGGDAQNRDWAVVIGAFFAGFNFKRIASGGKSTVDIGFTLTFFVAGGGEDPYGYFVNEDNQHYINENIKSIISQAEEDVRKTLITDEWKKMLKESALYLCENSAMPQTKMAEIYDKVADSVKMSARSETYYRDIIENI